ncbi:iron-siderophore ABC transporter substrate-binding protein [Pseudonocardia tropica]|uniref:Iron-siderophore ABC transporter substrate-binding protein n=1 Tax=Pseudonocardia tropica TaxID=681289 RepID=A0ABV1K1A3_9PSEU
MLDKTLRPLLGVLAALLLVAGCSGGAPTPEPAAADAAPRTVQTGDGPVEVPANPQRIVTLHNYTTTALLDVGVTPVGTIQVSGATMLPQFTRALSGVPTVGQNDQIDYEKIASLQPDLIVGGAVPGIDYGYDKLSAIAPTVMWPMTVPADWKRVSVETAGLVGRTAQIEELRTRYDQRAADLRSRFATGLARTPVALVLGYDDGTFGSNGPESWGGTVLSDIGARFASVSAGEDAAAEYYGYDQLPRLDDAGAILLEGSPEDDRPTAGTQMLVDQPLWRNRPAVRDGKTFVLHNFYPLHYGQALAVLDQLEQEVLPKL